MKLSKLMRRTRAAIRMRIGGAGLVGGRFESRIVWIFGSPRSGSTWLLQLLAEHNAVVPINEPLIGHYLGPFLADLPGAVASDLDRETFTISRLRRHDQANIFSTQFDDVWPPLLGKLLRGRFYAYAVRFPAGVPLARSLVAIKEPNGSQAADLIMTAMPRSRLLFLLRDGRDVVDSELAANMQGSWVSKEFPGMRGIASEDRVDLAVLCAYKWLWRTQVVQDTFRAHCGPKYLVRYEDLRREPVRVLGSIFNWLGIEADDEELGTWVRRNSFERLDEDARGPQQFFRAAEPGRWRRSLDDQEQAAVERVIGTKLRELGYEV